MELEAELASLDLSTCGSTSLALPPFCEVKVPFCYGCGGTKASSPVPCGHSLHQAEQRRGFAPVNSSVVLTVAALGLCSYLGDATEMAYTLKCGVC